MYLYIFEDGEVKKGSTFDEEDKQSCDDGILQVIRIDSEHPKTYFDGLWVDLESADT